MSVPRVAPALLAVLVVAVAAGCSTAAAPAPIGVFSATAAPKVTISPAGCSTIPVRRSPAAGGVPDVTLNCLGPGPGLSLAYLRGPALVNIWGSWCQPCVDELPILAAFAAADPQVAVVGVDIGDKKSAPAVAELSVAGVRYPNLVDLPGRVRAAGAGTIPTTYFVDEAGRIVYRHVDRYHDLATLRADVRTHLGSTSGTPTP